MTISKEVPQIKYPYLAVWIGKDQPIGSKFFRSVKVEDIVLISMVEIEDSDRQPYVQYVLGSKESYITKNEDEYCPLPNGYSLTLCQS